MNIILRASWGFAAALFVTACASTPPANLPVTAIVGATVIHPDRDAGTAVSKNETIVIVGDRIWDIGSASLTRIPDGAKIIDAKGKWVIPGLIDSHVHFFQSGDMYTRPDAVDFNAVVPYGKEVARKDRWKAFPIDDQRSVMLTREELHEL